MVVTYFIKKVSACFIASPVNNTAQKTLDAVALVEDSYLIFKPCSAVDIGKTEYILENYHR